MNAPPSLMLSIQPKALAIATLLGGNLAAARSALGGAIGRQFELAGVSLRPREYSVVYLIDAAGDGSAADIASFLAIPPASLRRMLAALLADGWLETVHSREDRRYKIWRASPRAKALVASVSASAIDSLLRAGLQGLPLQERRILEEQTIELLHGMQESAGGLLVASGLESRFQPASRSFDSFGDLVDMWINFSRLYKLMRAEQSAFFTSATRQEIDMPSYMAMYRINERPSTVTDLAAFMRVDQQTAVRAAERLKSQGYLKTGQNPLNRREIILSPTAKGEATLAAVPPLDPAGAYFRAVIALPAHGEQFSQALGQLMTCFLPEPVIDQDKLYTLMERVQQEAIRAKSTSLDGVDFRRAMSNFATGVAVVTIAGEDGPRGVTVNSLTSVSLQPPILLICFDRRSSALRRLQEVGSFGVNILSAGQKWLAQRFSRPSEPVAGQDEAGIWSELDGVPTLAGSLVQISCDLHQTFEAGTHLVVFGQPRQVSFGAPAQDDAALGYWRSSYTEIGTPSPSAEKAP